MKTTIEIREDLFRRSRATAALRGESLKELVSEALEAHLGRLPTATVGTRGWRSVFGQAGPDEVGPIDARVAEAFERVDPGEWR